MRKFYSNSTTLLMFSKCSIEVKCYLFRVYCSNLYCSFFWDDSSKTAMKKIKIAYNNSARRLLVLPKHNSGSEMFVNLNILSFAELLRKFDYSFQSRLIISDKILLSGIFNSTTPLYSPIGLGGIPFLESSRVYPNFTMGMCDLGMSLNCAPTRVCRKSAHRPWVCG